LSSKNQQDVEIKNETPLIGKTVRNWARLGLGISAAFGFYVGARTHLSGTPVEAMVVISIVQLVLVLLLTSVPRLDLYTTLSSMIITLIQLGAFSTWYRSGIPYFSYYLLALLVFEAFLVTQLVFAVASFLTMRRATAAPDQTDAGRIGDEPGES
jgi:hypothetical protein